jgi:hypothetical protein
MRDDLTVHQCQGLLDGNATVISVEAHYYGVEPSVKFERAEAVFLLVNGATVELPVSEDAATMLLARCRPNSLPTV